ncbi:MAG: thioredoxin [Methyloligellaceae bacterium]
MVTPLLGAADNPQGGDADLIKDTTASDFVADVIDASKDALVVVDFWAPWCEPCKQLTPMLEKIVKQADGAVRLVKLNIDDNPAIAQQMRVQSVPTVFAFRDGRPVDAFAGALPESQIRTFIERLAGADVFNSLDSVLETASLAFEAGDTQEAAEVYSAILSEDRENEEAIAGLAKCHIKTGDLERAEQILTLTGPEKTSAVISNVEAMLALARKSQAVGDTTELRAKIETNPNDHDARFNLAMALNSEGDKEGALEALVEILKRDRTWNDDAARKQLIEFFDAWGPSDTVGTEGRRRLSSFLFS